MIWDLPKLEVQLAQIGLAWRPVAQPPRPQEPQPFEPETPREREHQLTHYLTLGNRLARVGRVKDAELAYRAAVKLKPDDPFAHGDLAKVLEYQARYKEAEAHVNEAIRLRPEHGWFWVLRGWIHADMEEWEKASADFVHAADCQEPHEEAWYCRAMHHLSRGNLGGYREICADMIERFGTGATWTCTLSPNSGIDPARIVSMAENILGREPRNHWHVNQFGAALYRAGRFEQAVERLTEATKISADPNRSNMLYTWFYLAMAHHRLGHAELAQRWLDKSVQGTDEALKSPTELANSGNGSGVIAPNWHRRVTLRLLRREAEHLIHPSPAKASRPD